MSDEELEEFMVRAVALIAAAFCSVKLGNNSDAVLFAAKKYERYLRGSGDEL